MQINDKKVQINNSSRFLAFKYCGFLWTIPIQIKIQHNIFIMIIRTMYSENWSSREFNSRSLGTSVLTLIMTKMVHTKIS